MITEAFTGIATIRSNGAVRHFQEKFAAVHDGHTRAFFSFVASSRWFATRLDFVTFLLMGIASFASSLFYDRGRPFPSAEGAMLFVCITHLDSFLFKRLV